MADTNRPSSSPAGANKPQGSGSDTVSAANLASGTSGSAGQPSPGGATQSSTLASHTSRPLGGGAGSVGQGAGPEHLRHQDKDAGTGMHRTPGAGGSSGVGGGSSGGGLYNEASERAGQAYDQASGMARDAYDQASSYASQAYEQGSHYYDEAARRSAQARRGVERFVSENPVMVGVIGLAAGLIIGALLPRTRQEDRTLGRWADEVRGQGMRYARDMAQRGRELVEDSLSMEEDEGDWRQRPGGGGQRPQGRYQNH